MFSFFKKKKYTFQDFAHLKVDMHSHLIPGIDDGPKTMEDSIQLVLRLKKLGYQKIITTPHIMGDYYPNSPEVIEAGLEHLKKELKNKGIVIEMAAAAEYYVDEYFENLLDSGARLLTLPGNRLLVETSMLAPSPVLNSVLFRLNTLGYHPVLAHPERYIYYHNNLDQFAAFKSMGCRLQLNLLSLTGYYGKAQKTLAYQLLKEGWIDYLGTDLHRESQADILKKGLQDTKILKVLHEYQFLNKELL